MAFRLADTPGPPRHRWVWAVALAAVLPALNWFLTQSAHLGALGRNGTLVPGSGPLVSAELGFLASFAVLGLVPAVLTRPVYGTQLRNLGLGLGEPRTGGILLAVGLPLAVIAGYVGAASEPVAAVYPLGTVTRSVQSFVPYAALYLLYYIGFEYYYRGFLLLGLADRVGPVAALLFQAGLATLAHAGKPGLEFVAAFPASLVFGWAVLRSHSIWPVVAIHATVGISMDWFLLGP